MADIMRDPQQALAMANTEEHRMRFVERTLASVRTECICGWKAECAGRDRQLRLNRFVSNHLADPDFQMRVISPKFLKVR